MSKDDDIRRNLSDYRVIKSDLYDAYRQLIELKNAYIDTETRDSKYRKRYERGLRRSLDVIYHVGGPSRNIDRETAEKVKKARKKLLDVEQHGWEDICEELERVTDHISDSMGEQGYLDTRVDEDVVVDNTKNDIPDMFLTK